MIAQSSLPYTHSKRLFDRLAPYIGEALRAYPAAIVVDPTKESMSSESFAGYFRKARSAKQMYDYKHPAVDERLFKEHCEHLVCAFGKSELGGKLVIGPRNYGELRNSVANGAVVQLGEANRIEVSVASLDLVCTLVERKALHPMPEFIVRNAPEAVINVCLANHDVTIVPLDDSNKLHQIL